jgi:hypothetical protein
MATLKNMNVRFFIYDEDAGPQDDNCAGAGEIIEVDEETFIACEYPISYERNTIFENGVSQICLTKMPEF